MTMMMSVGMAMSGMAMVSSSRGVGLSFPTLHLCCGLELLELEGLDPSHVGEGHPGSGNGDGRSGGVSRAKKALMERRIYVLRGANSGSIRPLNCHGNSERDDSRRRG